MRSAAADVDVSLAERSRLASEIVIGCIVELDRLVSRDSCLHQPHLGESCFALSSRCASVRFHIALVVENARQSRSRIDETGAGKIMLLNFDVGSERRFRTVF